MMSLKYILDIFLLLDQALVQNFDDPRLAGNPNGTTPLNAGVDVGQHVARDSQKNGRNLLFVVGLRLRHAAALVDESLNVGFHWLGFRFWLAGDSHIKPSSLDMYLIYF